MDKSVTSSWETRRGSQEQYLFGKWIQFFGEEHHLLYPSISMTAVLPFWCMPLIESCATTSHSHWLDFDSRFWTNAPAVCIRSAGNLKSAALFTLESVRIGVALANFTHDCICWAEIILTRISFNSFQSIWAQLMLFGELRAYNQWR